jgi:capsular polysaccharide biosynthesis protein
MHTTTLSTVGRALRRRHWLIWGAALIAAALALGVAAERPPTYEATALLSIDESADANQGFDVAMQVDQFLSQRFISLATSQAVLQQVCAQEGAGCDTATLARQVRVTTPKATAQISVVAGSRSPVVAARLANEVARAVVARNAQLVTALVASRRTYLQDQLNKLNDQITSALAQANAAEVAGRTGSAFVAQLTALQTQYAGTLTRLQDLDVQASQSAGVISLQQPATAPARPVDPNPVIYGPVGAATGLLLGLLGALLAERLRNRVVYANELGELTGSSLVLDLSRSGGGGVGSSGGFLVHVCLARHPDGPRALMLVAASPRDRVNDVAPALARTVAGQFGRVLVTLVPSPAAGSTEVGETRAGDSSIVAALPGPAPAGALPARPPDEGFGLAIHCALPPLADPGAPWLRPTARTSILVATRGRTRLSEVRETTDLLRHAGVEVAGAILLPSRSKAVHRALRGEPERSPSGAPAFER